MKLTHSYTYACMLPSWYTFQCMQTQKMTFTQYNSLILMKPVSKPVVTQFAEVQFCNISSQEAHISYCFTHTGKYIPSIAFT